MTTLTDFLLARIADEERRLDAPDWVPVESVRDGWGSRGPCPLCDAYLSDGTEVATEAGWYDHADHAHRRRFVLADCEAKRQIVALAREIDPHGEVSWGDVVFLDDLHVRITASALRALALPYADHPDYDEVWRP